MTFDAAYIAEVITFVLMLLIIIRWIWPRIARMAEQQQDRVAARLTEAEKARSEAEAQLARSEAQLAEARKQAQDILSRATTTAEQDLADAREAAKRESEAFLIQAKAQIAAERDRAIQDLRHEAADDVVRVAAAALRDGITPQGHAHLIAETLASVGPTDTARN